MRNIKTHPKNAYHIALCHPLRWYICAMKWYDVLINRNETIIKDPNPASVSSRVLHHAKSVVMIRSVSKQKLMTDHTR